MRELVVDDVGAAFGVADLALHRPPVENDRSTSVSRLSGQRTRRGGAQTGYRAGPVPTHHDRPSMDHDGGDVAVRVGGEIEPGRQQGGVGRHDVAHLVGHGHVPGTFPTRPAHEASCVAEEPGSLDLVESMELGRGDGDQQVVGDGPHLVSLPGAAASRR